jgi:hypothetical protein
MANTLGNPTLGFQSFGRQEGGSPTEGMTACWIASTDAGTIFRGDAVVTSSGGGTNLSGNYITSINNGANVTSTGQFVRGIFQGCYQFQPAAGRTIWSNFYNGVVTGSTGDVKAYIIDDPSQNFLVQGSTKAAIGSSMVGLNIGVTFNSTSGNTTTGYSNVTVESTSVLAIAGLPFRIVDVYSAYAPPGGLAGPAGAGTTPFINGTDNTSPANMVIVRLNNCDRLNLTARSS